MPLPPKESIQSSEKSSHPSQRSSASTPPLSSRLDAGTKTVRSKCVANTTKINAWPLKQTRHAVSNNLSIKVSSAGSDELEQELGKSHNTSFCSLLVTSFSSQG